MLTRFFALAAAVVCLPISAIAQPLEAACAVENALAIYPEMEQGKAHFLKGNYAEMAEMLRPMTPNLDPAAVAAPIESVIPDGFNDCRTVVQRVDNGGFVQEVSLFSIANGTGVLALYMTSAPVGEGRQILYFQYTETIADAFANLR